MSYALLDYLLFEQFVVVRTYFFVHDFCHFSAFSLYFLLARSSGVVFLSFNARRLMVCVWAFLPCPEGEHDVALLTLLNALPCSISMSNCCDQSSYLLQMGISIDNGCARSRRPITVYHEEHGVEAVGVG